MKEKVLVICEKSNGYKYQGPRYKSLGPHSGEEFREAYLLPWLDSLSETEKAIIDFSGTIVYMPSFLEESFGGSIRANSKNKEKLTHIDFINMDKIWEKKLFEYIKDAGNSIKK